MSRADLPISKFRQRFVEMASQYQILVILGETGSGKTTQIPQYILESNLHSSKPVAITQPRRVAAISVSRRVAFEQKVQLGSVVGYSVRFENMTSSSTMIKFMTDGMLVREALLDPELSNYSWVIIDEAHERSVHTDLLMGLLKLRILTNPNLHVVIMSATIEASRFVNFFDGAGLLEVEGRSYPVDLLYPVKPETDYFDGTLIAIIQCHLDQPAGDILVFLTGQEEIEEMQTVLLRKRKLLPPNTMDYYVCCIYSALPSSKQMQVFESPPPNTRKIILSTNISETSLTIPGIKYVIDTGMVKIRTYEPRSGMEILSIVRESQAAARQRAGRAGRQEPGKCFRLLTRREFESIPEYAAPEITRSNLNHIILQLKVMNEDIRTFPFLDKPSDLYIDKGFKDLRYLNALDISENITNLGRALVELPIPPELGRILLGSLESDMKCTKEILTIVSLLSVENLLYYRREEANAKLAFKLNEGDHLTLLRVYREWKANGTKTWCKHYGVNRPAFKRVKMIRKQLKQLIRKYNPEMIPSSPDTILRCICKGYLLQCGRLSSDKTHYRTFKDDSIIYIHPTSVLFHQKPKPACIIFTEIIATTKRYVREVSSVEPNYIMSLLNKIANN